MATVNIAGIPVDIDAHRDNTPQEHEYIFAHLTGKDKLDAMAAFNKALKAKPEPKVEEAPPDEGIAKAATKGK